mgnify:CR=1 FL=1
MTATVAVFIVNVTSQMVLLLGAIWCVAFPQRRIYPMSSRGPAYFVMWALFYFVFITNFGLALTEFQVPSAADWHRLALGIPLCVVGFGLLAWGMRTLGLKNTSGLQNVFVTRGPYAFTRNPQYVGDFFLFAGVSVVADSELVTVTHMLTSLLFVVAPIIEEPWLAEQYGDAYLEFKLRVPRFL